MVFHLLHLLVNDYHVDKERDIHRRNRAKRILDRNNDIVDHPRENLHTHLFDILLEENQTTDHICNCTHVVKTCWCKKIKLYQLLHKYTDSKNDINYICESFNDENYYFKTYIEVIDLDDVNNYECENYQCRDVTLICCSCGCNCVIKKLYNILCKKLDKSISKEICEEMFNTNLETIIKSIEIEKEIEEKIDNFYYEKDDIYQACLKSFLNKSKRLMKQRKKQERYVDEYVTDMKKMFFWMKPRTKKQCCYEDKYNFFSSNYISLFKGEVPSCIVEKYLGFKIPNQPYNRVSVTVIEKNLTYKVILNGAEDFYIEKAHSKPFEGYDKNGKVKNDILLSLYNKNVEDTVSKIIRYGFSSDISNLVCKFL